MSQADKLFIDGEPLQDERAFARADGVVLRLDSATDVAALERLDPAWDHIVVVGPRRSRDADAKRAFREIDLLLEPLGREVAHGGLVVPNGFRTVYCDERTARGEIAVLPDRRDAVLIALAWLGEDAIERLGGSERVLRALLGARATKPLGRALAAAVDDGRWEDVHLAVAASDLLDAERLTELLQPIADAPVAGEASGAVGSDRAGVEVVRDLGSPRELGRQLAEGLGSYAPQRRARLIADLRRAVHHHQSDAEMRRRTFALRFALPDDAENRFDPYRERLDDLVDRDLESHLRVAVGHVPRQLRVALWQPDPAYGARYLSRIGRDVVGARVLVRLLLAWRDGGDNALCRSYIEHRPLLDRLYPSDRADLGGSIVHWRVEEVQQLLQQDGAGRRRPATARLRGQTVEGLESRLEWAALDLQVATTVWAEVLELLVAVSAPFEPSWFVDDDFLSMSWLPLLPSRHPDAPDPERWKLRADVRGRDGRRLLARALAERRVADPGAPEHVLDQLWMAEGQVELCDLLGRRAGPFRLDRGLALCPETIRPVPTDPLRPPLDRVPGAVAGVIQLLRLGAERPARPKSWEELADAVHRSYDTTELLARSFPIPRTIVDKAEGVEVPGTDLTVRVGSNIRLLADWSAYMGNCILTLYADDAARGSSVLLGLYEGDTLRYNLELVKRHNRWRLEELKGRFNAEPPNAVVAAVHQWVETLAPRPLPIEQQVRPHRSPPRRRGGGRSRAQREADRWPATEQLIRAVNEQWELTRAARAPLAVLATQISSHPPQDETRLLDVIERSPASEMERALVASFDSGLTIGRLWFALTTDPLRLAADSLSAADRGRLRTLPRLLAGEDVPRGGRGLLADPAVRLSWCLERVRRHVGVATLSLVRDRDPSMLDGLRRRPCRAPVLALAIIHSSLRFADSAGEMGRMRPRAEEVSIPVGQDGRVDGSPGAGILDVGSWAEAWADAGWMMSAMDGPVTLALDAYRQQVEMRIGRSLAPVVLVPAALLGHRSWTQWLPGATRAELRIRRALN